MSTPLQNMPQLRATFEIDAQGLIQTIGTQLNRLVDPVGNFDATPLLRNAIHSLRGAAAMVGAEMLTALVNDFERLAEVADSFRLTAPERARDVFSFLRSAQSQLSEAVIGTVQDKVDQVKRAYDMVHAESLAKWGGYFYNSAITSDKPASKPVAKAARAGTKTGAGHACDADQIARDFLSSLGVNTTNPPAAKTSPAPTAVPTTEQIDPEMLSYFILETTESLAQMESLVLAWEKKPDDGKLTYSIFRLTHTIKGAANSLGLARIGQLLHGLEDLLETKVVDRAFNQVSDLAEVILGVADIVKALVREAETGAVNPANTQRIAALNQKIAMLDKLELAPQRLAEEALPAAEPLLSPVTARAPIFEPIPLMPATVSTVQMEPEVPASPVEVIPPVAAKGDGPEKTSASIHQTIRVDSDRLDLLMNLIGELVISRSRLEKKLADISRLKDEMFFGKTRLIQAITEFQEKYEYSRPAIERNRLTGGSGSKSLLKAFTPMAPGELTAHENLSGFSELEFDQYDEFNILARTLMEIGTDTGEIFTQLSRFFDAFGEETDQFSKITSRLQDEITHVRMIPLTLLFQRLKRSSRDAARKEGKEINFTVADNDARLDKLILDQLYTPLLHIVRNAVSHGIEGQNERVAAGKGEAGQIHLRAVCEANQIVLEITDDGRGLNLEVIRATAVRKGLLPATAEIGEDILTAMIFQPGFSTAANVTDVSGRGIGLDVVRQEISRLGGTVHVHNRPGNGCTFVIHLPLTLAINQAMFIQAGDQTCALPLNFVERVQDRQKNDLVRSGQQELVQTPEGLVPFVRMRHLLSLANDAGEGSIVLARVADQRVAIGVDRILRKQDIVVKPLGPMFNGHPLFSGATLGGDGQVVMILDLPRVMQSNPAATILTDTGGHGRIVSQANTDAPARPTILVVDDSLSVRKVIEKHLHSLQYEVELAVDGLDALEKLRTQRVSLVLTDLEMPRMHGFELIAEMRRHQMLRATPVIVVTSRDAEKHRRRATSLGANDYIIKPFSRDQLAEYIKRHLNKPAI